MNAVNQKRPTIAAWVMYDVGNTLFLVGIVGLFFPLWVTKDMSGTDASVGYTLSAAMAFVLFLAPVIGALSDQIRRRIPFLIAATFICAMATLLLGRFGLTTGLLLFGLAVAAFNVSNMFYNGLLSYVSSDSNVGTIGGIGTGIGYLGSILAVVIGLLFVEPKGYEFVFRVTAGVMLFMSFPLFLLMRERYTRRQSRAVLQQVSDSFIQLRHTISNIHNFKGLTQFLFARFWYTWTVNTASTFAVLYASETVGFSAYKIQLVLLVGILVAIPSSIILGRAVDRVGPRTVLSFVLAGWVLNLTAALLIPWLRLSANLWWGIGAGSGVLVAGTWTSDRPFMLSLTPRRYLGEFFGLHSLVGRLSSICGYFVWGLIATTLGFGQPAAVLCLAIAALISLILIRVMSSRGERIQGDSLPAG